MENPNTIVIVGGNDGNQAKLETRLKPTRLDANVGVAVTSIYHGEVLNINETNNKIHYVIFAQQVGMHHPAIGTRATQEYEFEIPIGNYPSTASILKAISSGFKQLVWRKDRFRDRSIEPRMAITVEKEGIISIETKNITEIPTNGDDTPWKLIGVAGRFDEFVTFQYVKNIDFRKNIKPSFLYVNIVENSYINGKLSRLLTMLPISMNSDWSHYEFSHPNFVPIEIKEFSKITLEILDMDGQYVKFDSRFKTIITLSLKTNLIK